MDPCPGPRRPSGPNGIVDFYLTRPRGGGDGGVRGTGFEPWHRAILLPEPLWAPRMSCGVPPTSREPCPRAPRPQDQRTLQKGRGPR